jgi:hypothetical protein
MAAGTMNTLIVLFTLMLLIALLIALILLAIVPVNTSPRVERLEVNKRVNVTLNNAESGSMDVVVARYSEDIDWLNSPVFRDPRISCIVYNKGPSPVDVPDAVVKTLPNVGRCDHTFLYHIVQNYDDLADVTVFLPGSCMDEHKRMTAVTVLARAYSTGTTVLHGRRHDDVRGDMYAFELDEWVATNAKNKALNGESKLLPAPIRPFGAWYDARFPEMVDRPIKVVCYYGIFAVAREHVIQHPRSRYEALLRDLSTHSNPEVGHYMERAWAAAFYPYPESCVLPSVQ